MTSPSPFPTVSIFDGHNDTVHKIREYCGDEGIDFLAANRTGHLDLPRARAGDLFSGFFAMWVPAEGPVENDLTITETSCSVRLADPLDPAYARRSIDALRTHGFEDASLNKIGHEKWLRILRLTLKD